MLPRGAKVRMRNIVLGIVALFLAVLLIAAFAYSDPLYLIEKNMRAYNDGEIVSESLVGYIPPAPTSADTTAESTEPAPNEPYYAAAFRRMAARGIFPPADEFNPDAAITRARFTQVICALLGLEEEAKDMKGKTAYVDVPEKYWASGYINCATAHGLIGGVGDGFFGPEDVVLYEQGIKVALVCLGEDGDVKSSPNDWAAAYLARASEIGLSDGLAGSAGELLHCDDFVVLADRIAETLAARAAETGETAETAETAAEAAVTAGTVAATTATTTVTTTATTTAATTVTTTAATTAATTAEATAAVTLATAAPVEPVEPVETVEATEADAPDASEVAVTSPGFAPPTPLDEE